MMMERVEIRKIDGRWHAFNAGPIVGNISSPSWSTCLGDITVEEILVLFRSATVVFPPPSGVQPLKPDCTIGPKTEVKLPQQRGSRGGNARAARLSPERRSEIARRAAQTRWSR